ncbi:23S rRNA (pseudouridine(1915)-N(3))-methyltransferase RlmH [Anaerobiospirillum thomasii]|uniref:Ribosomal RNA large subunit methyltransferase H n=1 Tax=Anaerobiospirillum thomasii TaxID=179995 RepID=A0A2X0V7B0_9GAMM|nr:23S rRNA (pseudouridine(1915)-N(3))-methyltransferase RlmH [Anaerobiospirillum thomasii]SPT69753.1 Ribosomal RNA large subunit methyltransferase H [Anaerobiospirillum thomasii]
MKILVIAVGTKMPSWVNEGINEYVKRMPAHIKLVFKEIEADKRGGRDSEERSMQREGRDIIAAIPKKSLVIALDEHGKEHTSMELAKKIASWQSCSMDITLLIGGPNGLSAECKAMAQELWSLSKLTLPHPLVRVFLAETIYRAWSIDAGLPYHRE